VSVETEFPRTDEFRWPEVDPLDAYTTPERLARIDSVLRHRIVSVTTVFEDVFDPHNIAAGLRTSEGYGLHDVHVICNEHEMRSKSTVAKSADQWLEVHQHESTAAGVKRLKEQGFAIWVSDLQATETLTQLPLDPKIAIVVGNAKSGISAEMREMADRRYILPMYGMVQSFNLSVALAISLEQLLPRRRAELGGWGDMPLERMWTLRQRWLEFGQRHADALRRALLSEKDKENA
jgi:tRNA (guanosine-2'-O-)-methyltransferase